MLVGVGAEAVPGAGASGASADRFHRRVAAMTMLAAVVLAEKLWVHGEAVARVAGVTNSVISAQVSPDVVHGHTMWSVMMAAMTLPSVAPVAVVVFGTCGVYQLTPLKARCLRHCRSPLSLLLRYGSYRGPLRDVRGGAHRGAYCLAFVVADARRMPGITGTGDLGLPRRPDRVHPGCPSPSPSTTALDRCPPWSI